MTDLLAIRRPTPVSRLCESVPKPRGAIPKKGGLPVWPLLHLDARLPYLKPPPDTAILSRGKIGQKLWRTYDQSDFIYWDPHCYDVPLEYDALHDHSMKSYFTKKVVKDVLRKNGLINENGDVLCSLKQYNEYRRYLKRIYLEYLSKVRNYMDEIEREKLMLREAEKHAEREREVLRQNALLEEKSHFTRLTVMKERYEKEQRLRKKWQRSAEMQERQVQEKKDSAKALKEARDARNAKVRQRQLNAIEIERHKKVVFLKRLRQTDMDLKSRHERDETQRKLHVQIKAQQHWDQKVKSLKEMLENNNSLLEAEQERLEKKIEERECKLAKEAKRAEELLQQIKEYEAKKRSGEEKKKIRALIKVISQAWLAKARAMQEQSTKPQSLWNLETILQETLSGFKVFKPGARILAVIQEAKMKQKMEEEASKPVGDGFWSGGAAGSGDERMRNIAFDGVKNLVTRAKDVCKERVSAKRRQSSSLQMASGSRFGSRGESIDADMRELLSSLEALQKARKASVDSKGHQRRLSSCLKTRTEGEGSATFRRTSVSFGDIKEIPRTGILSEEEPTGPLQPVKDRPPTPVPSLKSLCDVFTIHEEKEKEAEGEFSKKEQEKRLLITLRYLGRKVLVESEKKTIDMLSKQKYSSEISITGYPSQSVTVAGLKDTTLTANIKTVKIKEIIDTIANFVKVSTDDMMPALRQSSVLQWMAEVLVFNVLKELAEDLKKHES